MLNLKEAAWQIKIMTICESLVRVMNEGAVEKIEEVPFGHGHNLPVFQYR